MKYSKLLLIKIIVATVFLICTTIAPASAIPVLTNGGLIFEFNSWEYLENRNPQTDGSYELVKDDILAGTVKLDSITDGENEIYSPAANGVEITGVFGGFKVDTAIRRDFNSNSIPDIIDYTFDVSDAWIKIYFDETPDFDPTVDTRAQSLANASNGDALLELKPQVLEARTTTGDSVGVEDDQTDAKLWADLAPYDPLAADPFDWNNPEIYQWGDVFEKPAGSGDYYPFYLTQAIYSPGHQKFNEYSNVDRWDYYDSDDLEGSLTIIPEPTTIFLFGFGLLSLASISRKRYIF